MTATYKIKPTIKALIGLSTLLIALSFCLSPWGESVDRLASDIFFHLRGPLETPSEIAVVAIDEPSFGVLQQQWPWPRSLHAKLIEALFSAGARVVAFDIIFAEPSTPDEDRQLGDAVERHPNVVLAGDFHVVREKSYTQEILVGPHPDLFSPRTVIGFVNLPVDPDGFVRRTRLDQSGLQSFPLLCAVLLCEGRQCPGMEAFMQKSSQKEFDINFLGPPRTMKIVSYYQALDPQTYLPEDFFKDKLVLVGLVTGSAIEGRSKGPENFPVPFSRWGGGYMAGVEIHAHAAHSFIHNTVVRRLSMNWLLVPSVILGILAACLFFNVKPAAATGFMVLGLTGGLMVCFWLFVSRQLYVSPGTLFIPPLGCYLVSPFFHYWQVWKEKNFIRKAFATYLAPPVVSQLMNQPEQLRLGGELVEATVFFLDVAGFTSLSERTQPEALIQVLNRYLGAFTEIVFEWNGMVDKFIGDAVMATWGVPIPQADHAQRACSAAVAMRDAMEHLRRQEVKEGTGLHLQIRIGINSGKMVAGNVGGSRHFNYTVLGDDVNLASRLEGVNRVYGTVIIISQNTARRVESEFELRELDFVRVKGKEEPVRIYELQGRRGTLNESQRQVNGCFVEGRGHYEQKRWSTARECFERGLTVNESDGPCKAYIERCRVFEVNPPEPDWDCAFSLEK